GGATPPAAPAAAPHAGASVLVITLDTVRADRVGAYGYGRLTTPRLDAFAQGAVLFEQAFATSSFTPPTHASILTGLYPAEHGLLHWNKGLADVPTAADAFAAAGYRTLAVTPLETLLKVGLGRGFQVAQSPAWGQGPEGQLIIAGADEVNAAALAWLKRQRDTPFFAWVHYYDAHRPYGRQGPEWSGRFVEHDRPEVGATEAWYQATPEKRERLGIDAPTARLIEDHYDGGLAFLDDRVGQLLTELEQAGLLEDTVVAILADHGEVFTEHEPEWFAHDPYLYEPNVRIPFLLRLPGGRHAGLHVPDLVSQVDVLPTLLELTGVAPLAGQQFSGESLAPLLQGRPLRRGFVFADRQGNDLSLPRPDAEPPTDEQVRASRARLQMLRSTSRKLLVELDADLRLRLLDPGGDAPEQVDLREAEHDTAVRAVQAWQQWLQGLRSPGSTSSNLSPEDIERLRAMGYL
ncbi:MAG: sulfatase, partial [Planctomycetes bacterium]|nr:sulfatase [Planctomycetota bacterium]